MGKTLLFGIAISAVLSTASCVTKNKYTRLDSEKTNYEMENRQLRSRVESLEKQVTDLENRNTRITQVNDSTLNANAELQKRALALEESARTLKEMQDAAGRQNESAVALFEKTKAAFSSFGIAGTSVEMLDGAVAIMITDNVLFTGNTVNADGKELLRWIAELSAASAADIKIQRQAGENRDKGLNRSATVAQILGEWSPTARLALISGGADPVQTVSSEGKSSANSTLILLSPRSSSGGSVITSN